MSFLQRSDLTPKLIAYLGVFIHCTLKEAKSILLVAVSIYRALFMLHVRAETFQV